MASDIISRADARAQGLTHYNTGNPCSHGHIANQRKHVMSHDEFVMLRESS